PSQISQSDRQLVDFLAVEIVEERRDQLQINAPLMLDDFVAIFRGSEVELVKDIGRERISIYFNISKSVPRRIGDSITPVRSVPRFEVVIQRGDCRLSICCSYVLSAWENGVLVRRPLEGSDTEYEDVFEISEISLYENDWNDCYYTMDDTLIDDNLYLLIMDVLAEKGITNEFVIKMSDLATAHEHATYIEFLENLSKFAVGLPLPYNDNTF
ncbi:hypothetical protein KR018_001251, partial [Drosophila ironensis]